MAQSICMCLYVHVHICECVDECECVSVCIGEVGWRVTYNCFVMLQEIYATAARYVCMVYMYMLGTEHNGVPFLAHTCPHTYKHHL